MNVLPGHSMPDRWAASFDDPSPYAYEALRWQRYEHEPPLLRGKAILVVVAVLVLLGFLATDVAFYENLTAPVVVSYVSWTAEGQQFATSAGFTVHTSQAFNLTIKCTGFCYRFNGAIVGAPFHLISTQIFYYPTEILNLTLRAPSVGYTGPLAITLTVD